MATALQKVLPQSVLPRAPSPNSTSPNTGVRASVTHFIAASPDPSFDVERQGSTATDFLRVAEASSSRLPQTAALSTETGYRRGIARSNRILGHERNAQEALALSQLQNGKIDVSFEASLHGEANTHAQDKCKGNEVEPGLPLFDVDLEAGNNAVRSPTSGKVGRLFSFASNSSGTKASSSRKGMDRQATEQHARQGADDEDEPEDRDDAHLLRGSTSIRPGYFAPGNGSVVYNSLDEAQGLEVGFEPVTVQESSWMAVSGLLVFALVFVAILISVDVIDWPGDGIGRQ